MIIIKYFCELIRKGSALLLTLILAIAWSNEAFAYDIAVDNTEGVTIYYNFTNNNKSLEVTCYTRMKTVEIVNGFVLSYKYYNSDGTVKEVTEENMKYPYAGNVAIPEHVTIKGKTLKVTSIGRGAFINCPDLAEVTIPNSVTHISQGAFSFGGLVSVKIPRSVVSIEEDAFDHCERLSAITVDANNKIYDSRDACNAIIETSSGRLIAGCKNTVIPNGVTSIGKSAFSGCKGLTSIVIPNGVTYIGRMAFWHCDDLISITIPNSVVTIDNRAFEGCSNLVSMTIPENVTSIGDFTFNSCRALVSIIIPESVTSIGSGTFMSCRNLRTVTIGKSVKEFGENAFYGSNLSTVISHITNPFPFKGQGKDFSPFKSMVFQFATLYVPVGTKEKYEQTEGWRDFVHIEETKEITTGK